MAALTIISQLSGMVSVNGAIEYVVKATPANDVDTVTIILLKGNVPITNWAQKVDLGSTDTYTFRVESIVQNLVTYNLLSPSQHGGFAAPNAISELVVLFVGIKQTGTSNTVSTPYVSSNTVNLLNACFQPHEPINFVPFIQNGVPGKRFLTNGPVEKDIRLGESEVLSILTDGNNNGQFNYTIRGYDAQGNLQVMPLGSLANMNAWKRMDIAIGTSNIAQASPTFLNNKVRYELVLNHFTGNLFTFGNNGTFDQNYNGITAGSGVTLSNSTVRKRTGAASLKMALYNHASPAAALAWQGGNLGQMYPNCTYVVQAYVYVADIDVTAWALKLELNGFADATVSTSGNDGVAFVKAFNNANRTDFFDKWHHLTFTFVTGADVQGGLKMVFSGTMLGVDAFVDDVSIIGAINTSKAVYHIKPACSHSTRVHFLNRLGAMDSYTFTGAERRNVKTEGSTYQKLKPSGFNPTARGRQVLEKNATVRLSCSSDALRPEEMLWLEELLTSPAVYVQRGNHNIPVTLRDGEFEIVDPTKNIHRLRVELEYANDMVLQRG